MQMDGRRSGRWQFNPFRFRLVFIGPDVMGADVESQQMATTIGRASGSVKYLFSQNFAALLSFALPSKFDVEV